MANIKYRHVISFEKIDMEQKAYILGLLHADGSRHSKHYTITLSLKDRELVEAVRDIVSPESPVVYVPNKKYPKSELYRLNLHGKQLCLDLERHGLIPNKTFLLAFPEIGPSHINHYTRGYFDGDGSISVSNNRLECSIVGNLRFCKGLAESLNSYLGFNINLRKKGSIYSLNFVSLKARKFLKWLYLDATLFLERKYRKALPFILEDLPQYVFRKWSKEDDILLQKFYSVSTKEHLLSLFPHTSWAAITTRSSLLGLTRTTEYRAQRYWTQEEKRLLVENKRLPAKKLQEILGRPVGSIYYQLKRLNTP